MLSLEIIDFILNYMETGEFFGSFSGIALIFYGTAIQSTYYLKKHNESSESGLETEA